MQKITEKRNIDAVILAEKLSIRYKNEKVRVKWSGDVRWRSGEARIYEHGLVRSSTDENSPLHNQASLAKWKADIIW